MLKRIRISVFLLVVLCSFMLVSCENDDSSSPGNVTSRIINVRLRAGQTVTYRARFDLDGVTFVSGASSTVSGSDSVITLNVNALQVPRGRHVIKATILAVVPSPSQFKMTASVTENGKVVVPDVPEVTASLNVMGTIEVAITF